MVFTATASPFAAALVFFAATLPNLFLAIRRHVRGSLGPRKSSRQRPPASRGRPAPPAGGGHQLPARLPADLPRDPISIFFRPARVAILPQLVDEDLITANSALWFGETFADVVGYALAGSSSRSSATALPLAFWLDFATYLASALLIATIVVHRPRVARPRRARRHDGFLAEMKAGWDFLRNETVLLANTLQATVGQFTLGILIALTHLRERRLRDKALGWPAAYGFIDAAIGLGNLVGGFIIGLIGARLAKGRMVILGYAFWGRASSCSPSPTTCGSPWASRSARASPT